MAAPRRGGSHLPSLEGQAGGRIQTPSSPPPRRGLMKQAQLKAKVHRKFKPTTDSKHHYSVNENLLNRNFSAARPGQVWVSDITYIRTLTGWLYLTVVLDLADRKIVGWALSRGLPVKH